MRRIIAIILFIILVSAVMGTEGLFGSVSPYMGTIIGELQGRIKSILFEESIKSYSDGLWTDSPRMIFSERNFLENGLITSSVNYNKDGEIIEQSHYEYNFYNNGKVKNSRTKVYVDSTLKEKQEETFDIQGRKKSTLLYDLNGNIVTEIIHENPENGKFSYVKAYDSEENLMWTNITEFDSRGYLKKSADFDINGNRSFERIILRTPEGFQEYATNYNIEGYQEKMVIINYDELMKPLSFDVLDEKNELKSKIITGFDNNGLPIMIKIINQENKIESLIIVAYDEINNPIMYTMMVIIEDSKGILHFGPKKIIYQTYEYYD